MADCETPAPGLPMLIGAPRPRPSLARNPIRAVFVSQLLAAHHHLPPQRERRRASAEGAVGAYAEGAKVMIRRMPAGYRTTILA